VQTFEELLERGKVSKDLETGCLLWNDTKFLNGYGRCSDKRAHRVSWVLNYGEIPDSMLVLHKCDVRACINPDHLWLGTQLDNMRDMISKGRKVVVSGDKHFAKSKEYKNKMSGENHWTKRKPERIARGNRHWSKLYPEKFSSILHTRNLNKNNTEEKKGSE
jgi:hypothetical protein